ncbi:MAG TPA: flagellar hook-length control protein FliK [Planctomycetaceae bacterium]
MVPDDLPDHAAAALRAAASLDRPIRIRLTPPELGTLRVEVSRQEGGVAARFEVTTAAAQSTLAEHLSSLRESLGRAGLPVERIEIRLAEPRPDDGRSDDRHGGERQESQQHGGQRRDDGERRRESAGRPSAESDSDFNERPTDDEPSGAASRRSDADLLDIQV